MADVDHLTEFVTHFTTQFTEQFFTTFFGVKQLQLDNHDRSKSEPEHDRRVLICGSTQEADCFCVTSKTVVSEYDDLDGVMNVEYDDLDGAVMEFEEEKVFQNQLHTQPDDAFFVHEVGDHEGLLAKLEDPSPPIHLTCDQLIHDKVKSLPLSDISSPSLTVNTALGMFSTNENKFLIAVMVFDENPKRNGYTVSLNPKPPDEYGLLITHDGALTELKLDPRTVKPIGITENYEGRSKNYEGVILQFNKYFVEGNPRKKMVQVSPRTSNTSSENWLVNSFKNTYVEYLVDQKFDMLQYGCSTKGKCYKIIIIAPVEQKKEQVFKLIQRAKCGSIETFHKFSQQGNKGITYAKYFEVATHMNLEKFLLHFPGGQRSIGQGDWTNVSTTMCPRRGMDKMFDKITELELDYKLQPTSEGIKKNQQIGDATMLQSQTPLRPSAYEVHGTQLSRFIKNTQEADFVIKKVHEFITCNSVSIYQNLCKDDVVCAGEFYVGDQPYKSAEQDNYNIELKPKPPDEYDSHENLSRGVIQEPKTNSEDGKEATNIDTVGQELNIKELGLLARCVEEEKYYEVVDKSHGLLTQNFVMLELCSTVKKLFTNLLLDSCQDELSFRTLARELHTNRLILLIVLVNTNSRYCAGNCSGTKVQFYDCSKVNQCQLKQLISCMVIGKYLIDFFIEATFSGYVKMPIHKFLGFRYDPGRENVSHLYWSVYTQISDGIFFKWEFIDIIMAFAREAMYPTKEDLRFRDEVSKHIVGSSRTAIRSKLSMRSLSFGVSLWLAHDDGSVLNPEVLELTKEVIMAKCVNFLVMALLCLTNVTKIVSNFINLKVVDFEGVRLHYESGILSKLSVWLICLPDIVLNGDKPSKLIFKGEDADYLEDKVVVTSWGNDAENVLSMRPQKNALSTFDMAENIVQIFKVGDYEMVGLIVDSSNTCENRQQDLFVHELLQHKNNPVLPLQFFYWVKSIYGQWLFSIAFKLCTSWP